LAFFEVLRYPYGRPIYSSQEAELIKDILKEADLRMHAAIQNLDDDLAGIRTGRATPVLVEKLPIDYFGVPTPLMQLASISVPEPRSLLIKPFDPSSIKSVERAILTSDLGLTPNNDGKQIRLNLPALTEERRRDLVKIVHGRLEECRIAIRNVRRDLHNDLRDFEKEKLISEDDLKRGEEELQKITDHKIEEINKHGHHKEQEIMEV
jgi:ribosome recycling factor